MITTTPVGILLIGGPLLCNTPDSLSVILTTVMEWEGTSVSGWEAFIHSIRAQMADPRIQTRCHLQQRTHVMANSSG
jgi:hypothetical protein